MYENTPQEEQQTELGEPVTETNTAPTQSSQSILWVSIGGIIILLIVAGLFLLYHIACGTFDCKQEFKVSQDNFGYQSEEPTGTTDVLESKENGVSSEISSQDPSVPQTKETAASSTVINIAQDEYVFKITNKPIFSGKGGTFRVVYNGRTYVPDQDSSPYIDVDLYNSPTSTWFVTDIDIAGDGIADVGALTKENPTQYTFWRLNGKSDTLESTGVTLFRSELDDFYKRDFIGTYRKTTVDWETGPMDCHQLVLSDAPEKFRDLKLKFSTSEVINLPWSDIPESDRAFIQENELPLSVTLERYFPQTSSHVPPCYSEFKYLGVETKTYIHELNQQMPVTIDGVAYGVQSGNFSRFTYDGEGFYISDGRKFTTESGDFKLFPAGNAYFIRLKDQLFSMVPLDPARYQLSEIDNVNIESFKVLGNGYALDGESFYYLDSVSRPQIPLQQTSLSDYQFVDVEIAHYPLFINSNSVYYRGRLLENLDYSDMEIGEHEKWGKGFYLRDSDSIYFYNVQCHSGGFYEEGSFEDIASWQMGC